MNNLTKILSYSTLGTLCAFLIQIISAKILSIHDYGVIAKWLTDLAFLSIFFVCGLDNALLFFSKKNNSYYGLNFYKNILFFSLVAIVLLTISLFTLKKYYYISLVLVCYSLAIIQSLNAYNLLNEHFNKYGVVNLSKNIFIFIAFLLIMILNINIGLVGYIKLYVFSVLISLVFAYLICFKPKLKIESTIYKIDSSYFKYGLKSMLNTLFAVMLYSSTIYILDFYKSKEELGVFFAATVLSKLAWVVPDSVGNLLYPKYLKIDISYSKEEVLKETYFFAQLNFILNLLAVIVFYLIGHFIIKILYDDSYLEMYWLVIILLIGNQGMVYYKILGRFQASINEWRTQRIALITATIFNVGLNVILIQIFDLIGAAMATAISFWVCGFIMSNKVKGSLKGFVNIKSFFRALTNVK